MPKEPMGYREVLEDVKAFNGGGAQLTAAAIAAYEGRDKRTVVKKYGIGKGGINAAVYAMAVCKGR
jgi:stage V sporulation protein SpoVS